MGSFILRRLFQSILTILGVMVLTFLLFRVIPSDIASRYVNPALGVKGKADWNARHKLDLPAVYNSAAGARFWEKDFWNTQFFWHLRESATFQSTSYKTNQPLREIIAEQAPYSLAITVPALALSWMLELAIAVLVAYYRDTWIDKLGVFFAVLGMCIPFLAYMIAGQWLMFHIYPPAAWGLRYAANIYVPVTIAVVAGMGGAVRFYRTIILDEVNRDYVRTAKAKGVGLPNILFKHVLKNCMLPILTSLVLSIPFLIMGNLLLESFFGIPGLGGLLLSSVSDRDVPIVTGLTFLTAVIYAGGLLLTDILYAVFDPRIRLR